LYAHLPILLHPHPQSALVICFGTGNTLGAAALHPLSRLDGVELSREVVRASRFFRETNHDVAHNPRATITIEDGRNFLLGTRRRYDVITEEPPLVHTAGVVNLYTRDFYQLCARRLTDDGIMAVWLATWELEDRETRMLVRAFVEAFPFVSAWDSKHVGEWILIGSKQPLAVDPRTLQRRMSEPALAKDLAKIGIDSPADLLALYLKGHEFLAGYTQDVPAVTDDRSVVDYTIPRQARSNFGLGDFLTGGLSLSGVGPHGLVTELRFRDFDSVYTHRESAESLLAKAASPVPPSVLEQLRLRRQAAELQAGRKIAWNVMLCALDHMNLGDLDTSHDVLDRGLRIVEGPASADLWVMKAALCNRAGRSLEAQQFLAKALAMDPANPTALQYRDTLRSRTRQ
jgi:hypothetical protein